MTFYCYSIWYRLQSFTKVILWKEFLKLDEDEIHKGLGKPQQKISFNLFQYAASNGYLDNVWHLFTKAKCLVVETVCCVGQTYCFVIKYQTFTKLFQNERVNPNWKDSGSRSFEVYILHSSPKWVI